MCKDITVSNDVLQDPTVFNDRFSRCYGLLYFIARRVLGGTEGARDSVQNCWLIASRSPSQFEHEGAFRSWLLRILIDEALAIRRKKKELSSDKHLGVGRSSESQGVSETHLL